MRKLNQANSPWSEYHRFSGLHDHFPPHDAGHETHRRGLRHRPWDLRGLTLLLALVVVWIWSCLIHFTAPQNLRLELARHCA
jgi:hypothetical protein